MEVIVVLLVVISARADYDVTLEKGLEYSNWICRDPELEELYYDDGPCWCGPSCVHFGTCCLDSKYYVQDDQLIDKPIPSCVRLAGTQRLVMIACPPDWEQNSTRAKCETPDLTYPDPLLDVPVTSRRTNITYLNGHCAICHQDFNLREDVLWPTKFKCGHILLNEVFDKPKYINVTFPCDGITLNISNNTTGEVKDDVISEVCSNISGRRYCVKHTFKIQRKPLKLKSISSLTECLKYDVSNRIWTMNLTCAQMYHYKKILENVSLIHDEEGCNKNNENTSRNNDCADLEDAIYDDDDYDNNSSLTLNDKFYDHDENSSLCYKQRLLLLIGSVQCDLEIHEPEAKGISVHYCPMYYSTKCAPDWEDPETEFKCKSYTDHYSADTVYRNMHCAYCNHVDLFKVYIYQYPKGAIWGFDFSILLQWNNLNSRCKNTEIYDPVMNRCRNDDDIVKGFRSILFTPKSDLELTESRERATRKAYITIAGIDLSMACLVLHLVIFLLTPRLMNLPAKNLASFCMSLLLLYSCFLASAILDPPCIVPAVFLHYSVLCTFCWMAVIAFDVWKSIRLSVKVVKPIPGPQWKQFLAYSAVGWIIPLIVLSLALIVEFYVSDSIFSPRYGVTNCWIQNGMALLPFVVAPLGIVMTLNLVLFSWSSFLVYSAKSEVSETSTSQTDFRLFLRLAVIMGLSWITGIIAVVMDFEAVWYVFVVLNTLQGLFIFIAFSCRRKTWQELVRRWTTFSAMNMSGSTTAIHVSS